MADTTGVAFLRPAADAVQAEDWLLHQDGELQGWPDLIPDWDYNLDIEVSRTVVVDAGRVRQECRLPEDCKLAVAAVWQASGTALRGLIGSCVLTDDAVPQQVSVRGVVPGREAAGALTVRMQLLLSRSSTVEALLVPSLAGTVLWEDSWQLNLEGEASRFPIEVVDFQSVLWAPAGAGWHLAWNPHDLRLPLSATLTLYINAAHSGVLGAVSGRSRNSESDAIRAAIYYDVGRALVRGALNSAEFMEDPDGFSEGTLGSAVRNLIHLLFPGDRPESLQSTMRERCEFFDSMIQEAMRLFSTTK